MTDATPRICGPGTLRRKENPPPPLSPEKKGYTIPTGRSRPKAIPISPPILAAGKDIHWLRPETGQKPAKDLRPSPCESCNCSATMAKRKAPSPPSAKPPGARHLIPERRRGARASPIQVRLESLPRLRQVRPDCASKTVSLSARRFNNTRKIAIRACAASNC